jgi:hypothetical protein
LKKLVTDYGFLMDMAPLSAGTEDTAATVLLGLTDIQRSALITQLKRDRRLAQWYAEMSEHFAVFESYGIRRYWDVVTQPTLECLHLGLCHAVELRTLTDGRRFVRSYANTGGSTDLVFLSLTEYTVLAGTTLVDAVAQAALTLGGLVDPVRARTRNGTPHRYVVSFVRDHKLQDTAHDAVVGSMRILAWHESQLESWARVNGYCILSCEAEK